MGPLYYKSAKDLVNLIRAKALSPIELMAAAIKRIEAVNPGLNAFVSMHADEAMKEAEVLTARIASGEDPGPLAGIPVGVKDLEDVKGMVTSFGSVPYRDNVARVDSIQVARLRACGAIILGKTNTPEFGFTGFTKNRLYGVTSNPWNRSRTPGGSSGGSAAAVAGGMVSMATGSDAGGSIRIPASYSGCFGLKSSFGRIPIGPTPFLQMYHILSFGPLTRSVADAALYLDCVAGYHPTDPFSLPSPNQVFSKSLEACPSRLRIAFSPDLGYARVQKDVGARVEEAVKCFEDLGHDVVLWDEVLPNVGEAWATLMTSELYGMLYHSLDRDRKDMGKTLVKALERARNFSMADHIEAQNMRTTLNIILEDVFERFDILLTPTMPTEAFAAEGPPPAEIDGHPISILDVVAFTYPFNLSGHPAASVPAGFTENGLPVGLQIIGPRHRDDLVLQVAHAYEQVKPWHHRRPDLKEDAI